jgi:carboxymethylenebutenolidase
MPRQEVTIETRDGICPVSVFTPADQAGPWPGVIFFMDGFGIRSSMRQMGQRVADAGYLVLLPDLYYRQGPYPPMVPAQVIADPKLREGFMKSIKGLDREKKIADAGAFVEFLSSHPDVHGDRFGITGYCMGGNIALTAAGAFPDRVAAAASFHRGKHASDQPDSPHLFLKDVTARIYVAGATDDASFDDKQKVRLEITLTDASVPHQVETYPARHGFAVPDSPAFDQAAAERHWSALIKLFAETLRRA